MKWDRHCSFQVTCVVITEGHRTFTTHGVSDDLMGFNRFNSYAGSHRKAVQKKFDSAKTKAEFLSSTPNVLSNLKLGDGSIYDSRVLHCGTSNRSDKPRILLYATFRNPDGPSADSDFWNVASIRPEYKGKYCLGDFM